MTSINMIKIKIDVSNTILKKYWIDNNLEKKILDTGDNEYLLNSTDSGLDLVFPNDINIPKNSINNVIGLGISCEIISKIPIGYYLYPRGSFSKTGLIFANHTGIIDYDYRGELKVSLHNFTNNDIKIEAGQRLFQICQGDLVPFKSYIIVNELSQTKRGNGAFGSTGKNMDKK